MDTVNEIWAQDAVRFDVVLTEVLSGGDVNVAPLGGVFPGPGDTDLNGDGVFQPNLISSMHTITRPERDTLQVIARRRMINAGHTGNEILLFFVRAFTSGAQGLTLLGGQRVMVSGAGGNTRANVTAHELGHALNISGDFPGVAFNALTEIDETRQTELMHTSSGPDPRDLETADAVTGRVGAAAFPQ